MGRCGYHSLFQSWGLLPEICQRHRESDIHRSLRHACNTTMSKTSHHAIAVLATFLTGLSNGHAAFSDANWTSMGTIPGVNGRVRTAVADSSGNLYVGGGFTIAGDVFATNIAKWDGSKWSAFGSWGIG